MDQEMGSFEDELRVALQECARHVGPLSDPTSGIERRVELIRRRRTVLAIAGSLLSVMLLASLLFVSSTVS
jgi:hypothetical protein